MSKIAVSSDSTSAISQQEAKELGIFILPLNVIADDVEYHDGINIDVDTLSPMMRGGAKIKTSTPTLKEMEDFFDGILAQGYDKVIHLTISSKLTSIFDMFTVNCEERYGDKVVIIDSYGVCSPMVNVVKKAKKMVDNQQPIPEILAEMERLRHEYLMYFFPETLTYLKRGGRISPTAALVGNMLGIKPILKFLEGAVDKHGTSRTIKQALPEIISIFNEKGYNPKDHEIHIVVFDCPTGLKVIEKAIHEAYPNFDVKITPISINVCAHAGPGTVGFGFTNKV